MQAWRASHHTGKAGQKFASPLLIPRKVKRNLPARLFCYCYRQHTPKSVMHSTKAKEASPKASLLAFYRSIYKITRAYFFASRQRSFPNSFRVSSSARSDSRLFCCGIFLLHSIYLSLKGGC